MPTSADELREEIQFELEQGGFESTVAGSGAWCPLRLTWAPTASGWTLTLFDRRWEHITEQGGEDTAATSEVAFLAVEFVYAWTRGQVMESPEIAAAAPSTSDKEPGPPDLAVGSSFELEGAPIREHPWELEIGTAFASLGPAGALVGLRRRWTRFEVGVAAEGSYLGAANENVQDDGSMTSFGRGGVARARVSAGWRLRPAARVRPMLGLGSELVIPIVQSRVESPDIDVNGPRAGVYWVPSAELGLRFDLRRSLGMSVGVRGGPSVSVTPLRLPDGSVLPTNPFFLGGGVGLTFGVG